MMTIISMSVQLVIGYAVHHLACQPALAQFAAIVSLS